MLLGATGLIPSPIAQSIFYLLMVLYDMRPNGRCDKPSGGDVPWKFEVENSKITRMGYLTLITPAC